MSIITRLTSARTRQTDTSTGWGLLILRIAVGGLLLIHGVQGLSDPGARIATTQHFGVPFPTVSTWFSILGELLTSLGVLFGCLTVVASVCMTVLMAVTWAVSAAGQPLFSTDGQGISHENALYFGLGAVALAILGAGRFSVDHALGGRLAPRPDPVDSVAT